MNEAVQAGGPVPTQLKGDIAVGAIAGLIAGLGVMTVVALAAIVALSKVTPSKSAPKARAPIIKKLEVEPIKGVQTMEEKKGGSVRPLFPDEKGIRE